MPKYAEAKKMKSLTASNSPSDVCQSFIHEVV